MCEVEYSVDGQLSTEHWRHIAKDSVERLCHQIYNQSGCLRTINCEIYNQSRCLQTINCEILRTDFVRENDSHSAVLFETNCQLATADLKLATSIIVTGLIQTLVYEKLLTSLTFNSPFLLRILSDHKFFVQSHGYNSKCFLNLSAPTKFPIRQPALFYHLTTLPCIKNTLTTDFRTIFDHTITE